MITTYKLELLFLLLKAIILTHLLVSRLSASSNGPCSETCFTKSQQDISPFPDFVKFLSLSTRARNFCTVSIRIHRSHRFVQRLMKMIQIDKSMKLDLSFCCYHFIIIFLTIHLQVSDSNSGSNRREIWWVVGTRRSFLHLFEILTSIGKTWQFVEFELIGRDHSIKIFK